MRTPTLEAVKALDGRIFAMLSTEELSVLDFYRLRGRQFDVEISILSEADAGERMRDTSRQHADEVLKKSNSRIGVKIGPGAEGAWTERADH